MSNDDNEINTGWIKLHRSLLEWEWYSDLNTRVLFIHFLLLANHAEQKWRGITIKEGQFLTGLKSLASTTGLTPQQIRTAISKLESTREITLYRTNKYSIISISNWHRYQTDNRQINMNLTNEQQTNNKQVTTNKNTKELKNEKNKGSFKKNEFYENKSKYHRDRTGSYDKKADSIVKGLSGKMRFSESERKKRTEEYLKTGKLPE